MDEPTQLEPITYKPESIKVYVQIDDQNRITAIGSSAFIYDTEGWIQIDEGYDNKKHYHAQGNYLEKGLLDYNGCYNYKLITSEVVERTPEEKQAEIDARPAPPPTPQEQIIALTEDIEAIAATTAYNLDDTAAIGETIAYNLEDTTALGETLAMALTEIENLKAEIAALKGE